MLTHARVHCTRPHGTIIPPHLLRRIALDGDAAQREAALATLATDERVRLARATYQLLESGAHRLLLTGTAAAKQRTVLRCAWHRGPARTRGSQRRQPAG